MSPLSAFLLGLGIGALATAGVILIVLGSARHECCCGRAWYWGP